MRAHRAAILGIVGILVLALGIALGVHHRGDPGREQRAPADGAARAATTLPPVRHVFVINIENKGFHQTWGAQSRAPYLAKTLRARGVLLRQYYGTAHHSLGNYLAQISGQGPSLAIQHDCSTFSRFRITGETMKPAQVYGNGCVYPKRVRTLPEQLVNGGFTWRGYMEDMRTPCQHSRLGHRERWAKATRHQQYATRHNPFMYFRSIISRPSYCRKHVKPLAALRRDLAAKSRTRSLSYITPDLCHDAHNARCADGGPGGLPAANAWFKKWVPQILRSPAFKANGMLVITADESEGVKEDSRACCNFQPGPNAGQPGIDGPGGGHIGALVISRFTKRGTTSSTPYNHYSLLGSIEDIFGLRRLGYARTVPQTFGADVFSAG